MLKKNLCLEIKNGDYSHLQLNNFDCVIDDNNCDYNFSYNLLTTLEGIPKNFKKRIDLSNNKLISLKGIQKIVKGDFSITNNKLKSLEYAPNEIKGCFYCNGNNLTSLLNSPKKIGGSFNCSVNNLTSLEGIPEKINGNLIRIKNKLISLNGRPKLIRGTLNITGNKYLKDIKKEIIKNQVKAEFYITDESSFDFNSIKEEFEKYEKILLKNKMKPILLSIKSKINKYDYGLSI